MEIKRRLEKEEEIIRKSLADLIKTSNGESNDESDNEDRTKKRPSSKNRKDSMDTSNIASIDLAKASKINDLKKFVYNNNICFKLFLDIDNISHPSKGPIKVESPKNGEFHFTKYLFFLDIRHRKVFNVVQIEIQLLSHILLLNHRL